MTSNYSQRTHFFKVVLSAALVLLLVASIGLTWFAGVQNQAMSSHHSFGFMTILSFAAGLFATIALPCNYPLIFVVTSLALSSNHKKGLVLTALFSLGIIFTVTLYGFLVAYAGKLVGAAALRQWLLFLAGLSSYTFGLSELGLFHIKSSFFNAQLPKNLQEKSDYIKSLVMGFLLGNIGVGCANPLFYILMFYIAGSESIPKGMFLGVIHGIGRVLPLILIVLLAMLGFEATHLFSTQRSFMKNFSTILLIFIGCILIPAGIFNLGEWWPLIKPLHGTAFLLAILLAIVPIILKSVIKKQKSCC